MWLILPVSLLLPVMVYLQAIFLLYIIYGDSYHHSMKQTLFLTKPTGNGLEPPSSF